MDLGGVLRTLPPHGGKGKSIKEGGDSRSRTKRYPEKREKTGPSHSLRREEGGGGPTFP